MKALRIEEVANGWVVYEPYPDPGVYDSTKTHVFETVEGLQKALPTLLGKEVAGNQTEQTNLTDQTPPPEDPPKKRKVVFDFGQPAPGGGPPPPCPRCDSGQFVIGHPTRPGHWNCQRGTCQLDFVV